jgi:NAD(P)-dependent dehydrogenase (short-subunit alcohol dehydrogenase family)|nr:SDR family NAD(P)-dependent oxidoreductase [Kofleriaceae bacterium]
MTTPTKTFLVIGASTGLGRATAAALARDPGHRVVTAGRHRGADLAVDLRDLGDIARAADAAARLGPLAGIACNAGTQDAGEPSFTAGGVEMTFAVNVLAHVAFVARLAPARGTRIGFVGSGTLDGELRGSRMFGFRGGLYTDAATLAAGTPDPAVGVAQNARDRYATSKLCDLLIVRALARRGVDAFAIDPGLMPGTGLARDHGAIGRFAWRTVLRLASVVMPGASTATRSGRAYAWALTDAPRGAYVDYRRRVVDTPAVARRDDQAEELYAHCLALAGVRDPYPYQE